MLRFERSASALLVASILLACAAPPVASTAPTMPGGSSAEAPTVPSTASPDTTEEGAPIPIYATDPTMGRRDARVTVVVFVDYECPACGIVHDEFVRRSAEWPWLRVVSKPIALPTHRGARGAAEAVIGVYALGGAAVFSGFARLLFEGMEERHKKGSSTEKLGHADYVRAAVAAGLRDPEALRRGLDEGTWAEAVGQSQALFESLGLDRVPYTFVNGRIYAHDAQDSLVGGLGGVLEAEHARADARVRAGVSPRDLYRVLAAENASTRATPP